VKLIPRGVFVHREARGDLPLLVCLAVLVAVLTALGAVGPTALARLQDQGLRQRMAVAETHGPLVSVDTRVLQGAAAEAPGLPVPKPTPLVKLARDNGAALINPGGNTLSWALGVQRFDLAFSTDVLQLPGPLPGDVTGAKLTPHYLSDAAAHVRYVQGQAPPDTTPAGSLPGLAVSQASADLLQLKVGQQITLNSLTFPNPQGSFVVTGIYQPVERGDDFWTTEGVVNQPEEGPQLGLPGLEVIAGALVGADGADRITADGLGLDDIDWQFRVTLGRAAVSQAAGLRSDMLGYSAALQQSLCAATDANGNETCMLGGEATSGFVVDDQLTPMLDSFAQENDQF
jgi:putative ABC transport system permease protein